MRNDAVVYFHLVALGLFLHEHFGIQVSLIPQALFHVVAGLYGALAVIDNRGFAKMPQKTVDTLSAVLAGKTIEAHGNFEEREPLAVWALLDVRLQFVLRDAFPFAGDGRSSEQVAVLWDKARSTASAQ